MNYNVASPESGRIRENFWLRDRLEERSARWSRRSKSAFVYRSRSAPRWISEVEIPVTPSPNTAPALLGQGGFASRIPDEYEETQERWIGDVGIATASRTIEELTTAGVITRLLDRTLDALLEGARDEHFEDGVDSNLSVGLRVLFKNHSPAIAEVLDKRLRGPTLDARVVTEILHTLGRIEDVESKNWRLDALVRFLASPSPLVRDAAAVGLSYLDDRRATPHLRDAIERETNQAFRRDLQEIVDQLGV